MARFDVYRLSGQAGRLAVDVQSDWITHIDTRVVVPLRSLSEIHTIPFQKLTPRIEIQDTSFLLFPTELAPIKISAIRETITNIEEPYRDDITAALDFLFQGF